MKKIIFILFIIITIAPLDAQANPKKPKGVISRVKDAAAYGFGWQLGKEGAKAAIEKGKEVAKSPKTKANIKKAKDKVKAKVKSLKEKEK